MKSNSDETEKMGILSPPIKLVLYNIIIAVLIFLLGRFSYLLMIGHENVVFPIYIPAGVSFAILYKRSRMLSIGIFIGTFSEALYNMMSMFNQLTGILILTVTIISVANTLQPLIAAELVQVWINEGHILSCPNNLVKFVIISGIGCIVAAIIGTVGLLVGNFIPTPAISSSIFSWWISDFAGMLIISPIFLTVRSASEEISRRHYYVELIIFWVLVIIGQFIFSSGRVYYSNVYHLEYLVLPFILWAVFRFPPKIAILHVLSISVATLYGILSSSTEHGNGDINESLLFAQVFLLVISATNLILIAMLTERLSFRKKLEAYSSELEQKVESTISEMKILKGFLPICATCKKIRDSKGRWQPIESYINGHSEVTFSHGSCPDCTSQILDEIDYIKKPN